MGKGEAEWEELVRGQGGVVTLAAAGEAGFSRHAVRWALKTGEVHLVRRGVYTTKERWLEASSDARHIMEVLAQQRVNPQRIACEASAATVLGLPTPSGPPAQPQLTSARPSVPVQPGARGARGRRGGQVVRRSLLGADEVWTLASGVKVTSAVRTVLDCSRVWDQPWGLAIADAAIMKFTVQPEALVTAAGARPFTPGCRKGLWVAEHARAQVESPLESVARGVVVMADLPEPQPQVWIKTDRGWYRVDLLDEGTNTIIEADGKLKYSSAEDLWQEKRREDALRARGFEVVRFTMPDSHRPLPWLAGYREALARGARRSLAPLEPVLP